MRHADFRVALENMIDLVQRELRSHDDPNGWLVSHRR
jgi:hypothetical protein